MSKRILLFLFIASALLVVGCASSEAPKNEPGASTSNANNATSTAPAKTAAATGEKIGVPECDAFIAAYDACITDKVPETARAQYRTGIEQWRSSWRKLAENPQTKASLAAACKQSAEQTAIAMKNYGCTF